ncbi:MAG: hypothetical protein IT260_08870, partial [Saprospiraceae bacterium]|nr:hypothetical protein [Saprospiraceae bacterium]
MKIRKKSSATTRSAAPQEPENSPGGSDRAAAPFRVSSVGHALQTKTAAKAAPKKKEVTVTQTGTQLQDTTTKTTVGFTHGADCYVYVSAKDTPVEASQAGLGKLSKTGGLNLDITRVRKLAGQAPTAAAPAPASPAPTGLLSGALAGAMAGAAVTPSAPVTLDISANQGELLGIVLEGLLPVPVVQYAKGWQTIPYENLPAALQAKLPPLSKIQFAEGTVWVVQDHRIVAKNNLLADAKRQWVKANHTTTEFTKNKTSLEKVLTDSGLGTGAVDAQTLKAIAAIMTVEG